MTSTDRGRNRHDYWNIDLRNGLPLDADEVWARWFARQHKCSTCGTLLLPDTADTSIQIAEPPTKLMDSVDGLMEIWHRSVLEIAAPFMPPIVEWPVANAIGMRATEYVAFHCPMRHRVRDRHPNAAEFQCAKCGTWRSTMFGPYNILPDGPLPFPIVFTVLGMMFVNDEVKALPVWQRVKGLTFTRAPRESEERAKGPI